MQIPAAVFEQNSFESPAQQVIRRRRYNFVHPLDWWGLGNALLGCDGDGHC